MKTTIPSRIVLAMIALTFACACPQGIQAKESLEPASIKSAVPGEEAQKKATALVRDVYSEEYQQARTTSQKAKLARKLIEDAAKETEPAGQYVLLRIARDMAAGAGDGEAAFQAIEELGRLFVVDALAMKATVLQQSSTLTGRPPDAYQKLVEALVPLLDEAIRQDRFDLADSMVNTAKAAASKVRDPNLRKEVAALADRVGKARSGYEKVSAAVALLKEKPTDLDANLLVGKYRCFSKLDWDMGLPMLARGSDAMLKELAELDLDKPKESEAQATIGDAWWDFAEKAEANNKVAAQQRAKFWYEQAVPGLSGLAKGKLEKRLRLGENVLADRKSPTKQYLADLKPVKALFLTAPKGSPNSPFSVRWNNSKVEPKDGITPAEAAIRCREDVSLQIGEIQPEHSLMLHPTAPNTSAYAGYNIGKSYRQVSGIVGINNAGGSSVLTFRVVGDGKLLWKSGPMKKPGSVEPFKVRVAGITTLALFVDCEGSHNSEQAIWIDPILTK